MPESGIKYVNRKDLLTYEEMHRLVRVFGDQGISKVRITGGEPFVRKGMMEFLESISALDTIKDIHITTNGTFTHEYIPRLEEIGIKSINLSLDSLDKQRFFDITRRDEFDTVYKTLELLIDSKIDVKINMVVMEGRNIEDILPMISLTKDKDLSVRFIEEMPFNGTQGQGNSTFWPMKKIRDYVASAYEIEKLPDPPFSTSMNYKVKGHRGSFGIIAAYTRSFCGTCNRVRITPQGTFKNCLYDDGVVSFRDFMRKDVTDEELVALLKKTLQLRAVDGFEAERNRNGSNSVSESMATIGG